MRAVYGSSPHTKGKAGAEDATRIKRPPSTKESTRDRRVEAATVPSPGNRNEENGDQSHNTCARPALSLGLPPEINSRRYFYYLQGESLPNAALDGQNLHRAHLEAMDLRGISSGEADARNAFFMKANLRGADFQKACLANAIFDGAILTKADCRDAILTGASFQEARMEGVDIRNAHIRFTDFRGAILKGALLDGATYNSGTIWPKGFPPQEFRAVQADY